VGCKLLRVAFFFRWLLIAGNCGFRIQIFWFKVGTHFFFGLLELFGHGSIRKVRADIVWPDGLGGVAAESSVEGAIQITVPAAQGGNGPAEAYTMELALSLRTDGTMLRLVQGDLLLQRCEHAN
jgi:hypothetical protein